MCGISGIIGPSSEQLRGDILSMVSVMIHRGPDANGIFLDPIGDNRSLAMGHNRLSIIDLTDHAAQPMKSRDGRYVLVYNGEIYNFKEIARDLDQSELPDSGFGDTAVLLAALMKWGPAALNRFNGMWAFLLYDSKDKTLLVSRDRFGVKPLYYYDDGKSLYFASEVKAILAASKARLRLNPEVAVPYLTRSLLNCGEETFFSGINQFAPASFQLINLGHSRPFNYSPTRFWKHPFEKGGNPARGTVSPMDVKNLFLDAVKLRLRSDVPVGVLLSGGIDSSAILGGLSTLDPQAKPTILSVISDNVETNEEPFIDCMAEYVNLSAQKVNVSNDPLLLVERLSEAVWFNDEPICGIADIAYLRLIELARSFGIKVLLSGQGSDEQLGGYNKFFYFWLFNLIKQNRFIEASKLLVQSAIRSNTMYEFRWSEAIRYISKKRLASETFISPRFQTSDQVDIGPRGSYSEREWVDLTKLSLPQLLHFEDRMSMSQSVEVRAPFLDFRLIELLAKVHPSEKFEGGWTKSIFRKAIHGMVPKKIQYRRDKKGFSVPENDWMKSVFVKLAMEMFNSPMMSEDYGIIDRKRLRDLYAQFLNGGGYLNGRHFFRVYIFETFLRRFSLNLSGSAQPRPSLS